MYAFDSNKSIHLSKKMMNGKKFGSTLSKQAHMERRRLTIITEESKGQIKSNIKYWQNAKDWLIFGFGRKDRANCMLLAYLHRKKDEPFKHYEKGRVKAIQLLGSD